MDRNFPTNHFFCLIRCFLYTRKPIYGHGLPASRRTNRMRRSFSHWTHSAGVIRRIRLMLILKIARRLLDAVALRFSEAEKRLDDFRMVTAPPRIDEPIDFGHARLYASQFNPAWIRELNIEPLVLFDVGAFDAGVSGLLRRSFPHAAIFTFEADPSLFATVEKNAELFNAVPVNLAICDRDGLIEWNVANGGGQGSIFPHTNNYKRRFAHVAQVFKTSVACGRLDTFCDEKAIEKIDFMHIDVEGAEHEVITSLGDLRPRLIFLETISRDLWIGAKSSAQVHRLLSQMGYCVAGDFRSDRLYIHYSAL
jgi:FkbM family methyltransferase